MAEESSGLHRLTHCGDVDDQLPPLTDRRKYRQSRLMSLADRRRSSGGQRLRSQSLADRRKSVSLCRYSVESELIQRRRSRYLSDVTTASRKDDEDDCERNIKDGEEEEGSDAEKVADPDPNVPHPEFPPIAFFVMHQKKWPRSWCLKAITWSYPFKKSIFQYHLFETQQWSVSQSIEYFVS